MTRRILENARERHVERETFQARSAACSGNEGLMPVLLVEAFSDVLAAVKPLRWSRQFIDNLQKDVAITRQRRKELLHKFRCNARRIGRLYSICDQTREKVAADIAWKDLYESVFMSTRSLRFTMAMATRSLRVKSVDYGSDARNELPHGRKLQEDATVTRQRGNALLRKLRCVTHCIGRFYLISRKKITADTVRKGLSQSIVTATGVGFAADVLVQPPCEGEKMVALGGGNVMVAFRRARKAMTDGHSLPRSPAALLKSMNPTEILPEVPPREGSEH